MKYKISWFVVFFLSLSIFLWFSIKAFIDLNSFYRLTNETKASIEKVAIKNFKNKYFKIEVTYSFTASNIKYFNSKTLKKVFINKYVANEFIQEYSKRDLIVYYNNTNPKISDIEKSFPIKTIIYATVTTLIFLYFVILKLYISKITR